jgi:hypothetical protein
LFEHAQKRENDNRRFQAAIHGAEVKDAPAVAVQKKKDDKFMFGDPEEYKNMPKAEREALTKTMMGSHKRWGQSPISPKIASAPGRIKWT